MVCTYCSHFCSAIERAHHFEMTAGGVILPSGCLPKGRNFCLHASHKGNGLRRPVICPSALRVSLHSLWCDVLRAGESKAGLEGLVLLLKRIRLIAERGAATPAERLLDDLLRLLDSSEGAYDANEVQEVLHTQASKTLQHHDGAH